MSEFAAALCWFAMAFVTQSPAVLLAIAFASSVVEVAYFPASSAAIPNVAGEEHLSWANSLLSVGRYAGLTFGPIVGGLLVAAIGPEWVFAANGVSFLASVALTWSVRADFADPERDENASEQHRGVLAGFRFVRRDRVLRLLALSFMVFIVGMATTLVADPVLADEFGTGSLGFGLISALWGAGTIVGVWLGRGITEETEGRWMVGSSVLVALTGFGVALSPWFGLALFWMFAFGATDGPSQVIEQNLLQRRSPDVVRSRVMGAWEMLMHGSLVGGARGRGLDRLRARTERRIRDRRGDGTRGRRASAAVPQVAPRTQGRRRNRARAASGGAGAVRPARVAGAFAWGHRSGRSIM